MSTSYRPATGQVTWIKTPVHRILSSFLSGSSCLEHTFPSAHCPSAGPWISKSTALSHTLQPHRHFCDLSPEACRAGFHRRSNCMTGKRGQCSRNSASGPARRARLMWSVRWGRPGALQSSAASVVLCTCVQEVEHEKAYNNRTDRSEAGVGCQHYQPDSGPVAYTGSNTRQEEACHEERDRQREEGELHDENDHILPHPCRRHMPISLLALCSAPRSTSPFPGPCTARRRRGTRRHLARRRRRWLTPGARQAVAFFFPLKWI